MKKVCLTGSESTGKTELAQALGEHFGAPVAEEFVREFARQKGAAIAFEDHGPIARGQLASEDAAIARATSLVILDTDLVSTVVYCDHYFGRAPAWIEQQARSRLADLYLLLKPDVPWVPDGVRDRGSRRGEMHALFQQRLDEMGATVVEIGGNWEERRRRAIEAIEVLIASARSS